MGGIRISSDTGSSSGLNFNSIYLFTNSDKYFNVKIW